MKHASEEQLLWHYYGEPDAALQRHLVECEQCRGALETLRGTLDAVQVAPPPELPADYGQQVWASIAPRLERPAPWWRGWLALPRLRAISAVAALVLAAFLLGRFWQPVPVQGPPQVASQAELPQRVLLVALGEHLDRSQMVLLEVINTNPNGTVDLSAEQRMAEDLLFANRLYRQTASINGETSLAESLEELERVLLQLANGPSEVSAGELRSIQQRLESHGILFKVRVLGTRVRGQAPETPARPNQGAI